VPRAQRALHSLSVMAQAQEQKKPWRARAGAVIVAGSLLGVAALLAVRASEQEQQARDRARWEAEREQLNQDLQRLQTQFRQLQELQERNRKAAPDKTAPDKAASDEAASDKAASDKAASDEAAPENSEWLCDRVPCNQGDLIERPRDGAKSPPFEKDRQMGPEAPTHRPSR
jgi:hypothetical protein